MNREKRKPLRAGTIIGYCGMKATVVADTGGDTVAVDCEGHRQNWRWSFEGATCEVLELPRGELFYRSFKDYVRDFPQAEHLRNWLTRSTVRGKNADQVWLYRLVDPAYKGSPHGGIIGNYMVVNLSEWEDKFQISASDCDDGLMRRVFPASEKETAFKILEEWTELAPFSMYDIGQLYTFEW